MRSDNNYNFIPSRDFISPKYIEEKILTLRKKIERYKIPVPIEEIVEFDYKISIIPKPSLKDDCDVDALILSSWEEIIVDKEMYDDERRQNRLRFSLAHELGHLILHREKWKEFNIEGTEGYKDFLEKIDGEKYNSMETQANMFANNFLVPRKELKEEREKVVSKYLKVKEYKKEFSEDVLNKYLAKPLSKKFKVSEEAIEIALKYINNVKRK